MGERRPLSFLVARGKALFAGALAVVACLSLPGCLPVPSYPDDSAVVEQFPNAVPSTSLSCLETAALASFWQDCGILFSGNFEVSVDTAAHTASLDVLTYNGHGGMSGTLNGRTGPGANQFSGGGALQSNPVPGTILSTFACKAYDTGQPCGLVACNWKVQLGETLIDLGVGILPATQEAFCTSWAPAQQ